MTGKARLRSSAHSLQPDHGYECLCPGEHCLSILCVMHDAHHTQCPEPPVVAAGQRPEPAQGKVATEPGVQSALRVDVCARVGSAPQSLDEAELAA